MQQVITTERTPIKLWLDDIEDGAAQQARNLANLPFAYKHVALMPDCHQGYGMPIGGVLTTDGAVIPNAVGVDIGCGVVAARTNLTNISQQDLKSIMGLVRKSIPVGFNHHKTVQREMVAFDTLPVVQYQYAAASRQIGTLGGGNHFIEIQKGDDGYIWVMIHSGSRNVGKKVADHYNGLAKKLNAQWFSSVPPQHDLAFLPLDTDEGQMYLREMDWCLGFARHSRDLMMQRVLDAMVDVVGPFELQAQHDVHHNYAAMEHHFGRNVLVHRKGATRARKGEIGIIPGSQGTSSYIVRGKGDPQSFCSCSHGAGRRMGRKQAQRTLDLQKQIDILDQQGIVHGIRNRKDLDEAPGAYKDIDVVICPPAGSRCLIARTSGSASPTAGSTLRWKVPGGVVSAVPSRPPTATTKTTTNPRRS